MLGVVARELPIVCLAALLAPSALVVQTRPAPAGAGDSVLDRHVAAFHSNNEPVLQAILRFGLENHIPLGFVIGDQRPCSVVITGFSVEHASAGTVFREFAKRLPSYHWELEDGAVVFVPDSISEPAARFLAVIPPPYTIPEDVLQGQVAWFWVDIRAALRPREGTFGDTLSSLDSEKWPALALRGLTVRQVLNRLVARNKGGAWVLAPFRDFDKVADHRPFWLLDYSDPRAGRALSSACSVSGFGRGTITNGSDVYVSR